jgi:carboxymethylenebutenolidase
MSGPYLPVIVQPDCDAATVVDDTDWCQCVSIQYLSPKAPRTPKTSKTPVRLFGNLWFPKRAGPFPAMISNHGSEEDPTNQEAIGQYFTSQGFVLFAPIRRGHGGNPGEYIGNIADIDQKVEELVTQSDDVVAALQFLKLQPWIAKHRIGVMGVSYGGQVSMYTAQRDLRSEVHQGFRVAVDIAGGAMSWGNDKFKNSLETAAKNSKLPVFFVQSSNDFTDGDAVQPSMDLAGVMARAGIPHQMMMFPVHHTWHKARLNPSDLRADERRSALKADHESGHGGFGAHSPEEWGPWVLSFLQPYLETSLIEIDVAPADTDSAITDYVESHCVVRDSLAQPLHRLAVFLPGTDMLPGDARILMGEAAHCGYDVIGLRYQNDKTLKSLCPDGNNSCLEQAHLATIHGGSVGNTLTVAHANSIQHRLVKLLQYLHTSNPAAGWDLYLDGDQPHWKRIMMFGHGVGGSHAAYIAKLHVVERVVMLSAPREGQGSSAPDWLRDSPATPTDKYYSFFQADEASAAQEVDGLRKVAGAGIDPFDIDKRFWGPQWTASQALAQQRGEGPGAGYGVRFGHAARA